MLTHILESHIGTLQFILDDLSHQWYWPQSPSSQSVSSYLKSSQFLLRIEEPSAFSWPGPSSLYYKISFWSLKAEQQLREQHEGILLNFPSSLLIENLYYRKKTHWHKIKFWLTFYRVQELLLFIQYSKMNFRGLLNLQESKKSKNQPSYLRTSFFTRSSYTKKCFGQNVGPDAATLNSVVLAFASSSCLTMNRAVVPSIHRGREQNA